MLISLGHKVPRVLIHLPSQFFLKIVSSVHSQSITHTDKSTSEWPALLKWAATGVSSILPWVMSNLWPFILHSSNFRAIHDKVKGASTKFGQHLSRRGNRKLKILLVLPKKQKRRRRFRRHIPSMSTAQVTPVDTSIVVNLFGVTLRIRRSICC